MAKATVISKTVPDKTPGASIPKADANIDLRHQITLLRGALQSEKRNVAFFLGAGCPLGIYDSDNKSSLKLIPDVIGLTDQIESKLDADSDEGKAWALVRTACTVDQEQPPHVEHILTQLRTCCSLRGIETVDGVKITTLKSLDDTICSYIKEIVDKSLPDHRTSYHRLALWIQQIDRTEPLELFTPNYDLLIEQALEKHRIPYFDGFVGSREPFFDPGSVQQDRMPSTWARLWKIHGSINWIQRGDNHFYRGSNPEEKSRLLIYPSHLKYDQSRRMPYLAMIDRLRSFFTNPNAVMLIAGYSFADKHLTEAIVDGLRDNKSAQAFALMYPTCSDCYAAIEYAKNIPNLTLLAADGGVVGGCHGTYINVDAEAATNICGFTTEIANDVGSTSTVSAPPTCQLGDFHHLTMFLEAQFGVSEDE